MSKTQIFFSITTIVLLISCTHNPDLTNVPEVQYSIEIQAILSANCTMSGCHDGNAQSSFIGYENTISNGGIKPFNAHGSKLYRSITGRSTIMPPSSKQSLTSKQLQQIYVWIEQGAKNN
ncbi:MAG: hypothetical protein ABI763_12360 [Bacteroidota bacterium]